MTADPGGDLDSPGVGRPAAQPATRRLEPFTRPQIQLPLIPWRRCATGAQLADLLQVGGLHRLEQMRKANFHLGQPLQSCSCLTAKRYCHSSYPARR